ncbi:MAG: phosphomannomutase/phosphoglucomutase [Gammaproteobacteria bacterium]|nr:phosphomannomutase/phosphoglucomutase [Gammaproteobacteria bacterium]
MSDYKIYKGMSPLSFRTYDIRGVVGEDFTPDSIYTLGLAIGSEAQDRGQKKIIIGRDGRLSGPELLKALSAGLRVSGMDVINLGEVTTPSLYYATNVLEAHSGIMLTGSHNPPNFNGIKTVLDGVTICEGAIQDFYKRIQDEKFHQGAGGEEFVDILERYAQDILARTELQKPLKIVIDCGNGVGGKVAPQLFRDLGCEVVELFCDVDGNFPNHHPDPLIAKNLEDLIKEVKANNADIGLAFDGDADRLGMVTDTGEIIWPDRVLILFARDILPQHQGEKILFDVKCTKRLPVAIKEAGGEPEMVRTGHALLKARIKETNAPLGGELSGHTVFNGWPGLDDGIYSGAQLLRIISADDRKVSEVFAAIPNSVNTPELHLPMGDEVKYQFMQKFIAHAKAQFADGEVSTIDGLRVDFADGFGLVRPSNTTPNILLRFEGFTKEALERIKEQFRIQLLAVDSGLSLPF